MATWFGKQFPGSPEGWSACIDSRDCKSEKVGCTVTRRGGKSVSQAAVRLLPADLNPVVQVPGLSEGWQR